MRRACRAVNYSRMLLTRNADVIQLPIARRYNVMYAHVYDAPVSTAWFHSANSFANQGGHTTLQTIVVENG